MMHLDTDFNHKYDSQEVRGTGGHDHVVYKGDGNNTHRSLIGIATFAGDDLIEASNPYRGQIHIFAGMGDDRILLDMSTRSGIQARCEGDIQDPMGISRNGHHVYGGSGADVYDFVNVKGANNMVVGRIDDFEPSRDQIRIDGRLLDLDNPPAGVKFVLYKGQQWLVVNSNIFYALDGARRLDSGAEERHFTWLPEAWRDGIPSSEGTDYKDPLNFVPMHSIDRPLSAFNFSKIGALEATGSNNSDYIFCDKSGGSDNKVRGLGGNDVINGNTGHDKILGGAGNDLIAGGIDNDRLHGGTGNDTLWGGDQNDMLRGGNGRDLLDGGAGNDKIRGGGGADTFIFDLGNDKLVGGRGRDTIEFEGAFEDYSVTFGKKVIVTFEGDRDVLIGMEQLEFDDVTYARQCGDWVEVG